MPHRLRAHRLGFALIASLLLVSTACEVYDPPPKSRVFQPPEGYWTELTPIEIRFTEPVQAGSFSFSIWPSEFDIEGDFLPGARPIVEGCTLASAPCPLRTDPDLKIGVRMSDDKTRVIIDQNEAFTDFLGRPLVLIVHAGLKDLAGRERRVDDMFDFQINPRCGNEPIDMNLTSGVITLAANLQVLPIWLYLYLDVAVDPETGRALLVGSFARLKQGQDPGNNFEPDAFELVLDPGGWAVSFTACIVRQPDGGFFLQSDPFDVNIVALGAIPITLGGFTVQGTLREGTGADGRDQGSGTLSTTRGSFGDPPNEIDPITTAWNGLGLFPNEIPEGLPRVCTATPCTGMDAVGADCQLERPWTPGDVCPADEE